MAFAFKQSSPGGESLSTMADNESRLPGLDHLLLREKRDSFDEDARSPSLPPPTALSIHRPSTGRLDDYALSSTAPATSYTRFADEDRPATSAHRPSVSSIHSLLNGLSVDTSVQSAPTAPVSSSSSSRQTPTRGTIGRVASSPNLTPRASSSSRFAPNNFGYHMPPPPTAASTSTSASASSFRRLSGEEDTWSDADSTSSANMHSRRPDSSSSRISSASSASMMPAGRPATVASSSSRYDYQHGYHSPSYAPAYQNQMQIQQQSAMQPGQYPPHPHQPSGIVHPSNHSRAPISRTTKACNACRSRKVRCDAGGPAAVLSGEELPCSRCQAGGVVCVYSGQQRKRGPTPGSAGAGRPPLSKRKSSMAGPYAGAVGGPAFDPQNGALSHSVRSSFSDFRLTTPPDEWASHFPPGQISPGSGPRTGPARRESVAAQQRYGARPSSPHDVRYDSRYPGVLPSQSHEMDDRRMGGYPAQPSPMSMPHEHYLHSQPGYASGSHGPATHDKQPGAQQHQATSSLSGWTSPAPSDSSPRLAMPMHMSQDTKAPQARSSFPSLDSGMSLPPLRATVGRGSV